MKSFAQGFGLLEAIVAVAVISIISTVAYTSYQNHILRTQEEVAKHDLMQMMGDFQMVYIKTGAFADPHGSGYSSNVVNTISEYNQKSKYFTVKIYPSNVANAHQYVCLLATPKADTLISAKAQKFVIDNYGKLYVDIPASCLAN